MKKGPDKKNFDAFLTRLHWHCHFIQKFETDCSYATHCINKAYEELQYPSNEELIMAWKEGKTGFPLVDANMRCLKETGWINFRMRALLVSFFCHHLLQNWKDGVSHLANLFLDFEPGIHYPQVQMQSGANGGTVLRMYNPVTQAVELDPEGRFVRQWVPELRQVSDTWIFEPWKMTPVLRQHVGWTPGADYPCPLVDFVAVHRAAKDEMTALRAAHNLREVDVRPAREVNAEDLLRRRMVWVSEEAWKELGTRLSVNGKEVKTS
jgi:deoxyribodipyrimidine photo-lyase